MTASDYYTAGDWETLERTRAEWDDPDGSRQDRMCFLPDPDEIAERIKQVDWLNQCGFNNSFICSVMQFDCPHVSVVERLVEKHGVDDTKRRLAPMLEETEYDKHWAGGMKT